MSESRKKAKRRRSERKHGIEKVSSTVKAGEKGQTKENLANNEKARADE